MSLQRKAGFTLIEVAISVAILATLITAAYSLLLSTQQVTLSTVASVDLDEEARRAIRLLRNELRQSGFEAEAADSGDYWANNQCLSPMPATPGATTFGTGSVTSNVLRFRKRIGFELGPHDTAANIMLYDWTNDGASTPTTTYVVYERVVDDKLGVYRGVPGGTQTRYKLVRKEGLLNGEVELGPQIRNLEDAEFSRLTDWNTVLVKLKFMFPNPAGQGAQAPQPLRRKIEERIQMMNPTTHTN